MTNSASSFNILDDNLYLCPVSSEPLTAAVSLFPCCHKVNETFAEKYFGKMVDDHVETRKTCPVCRIIVTSYRPDHVMRALVEGILKVRKKLENKRSCEDAACAPGFEDNTEERELASPSFKIAKRDFPVMRREQEESSSAPRPDTQHERNLAEVERNLEAVRSQRTEIAERLFQMDEEVRVYRDCQEDLHLHQDELRFRQEYLEMERTRLSQAIERERDRQNCLIM